MVAFHTYDSRLIPTLMLAQFLLSRIPQSQEEHGYCVNTFSTLSEGICPTYIVTSFSPHPFCKKTTNWTVLFIKQLSQQRTYSICNARLHVTAKTCCFRNKV